MKFLLSTLALGAAATAPALDLTGTTQETAPEAPEPVTVTVAGHQVAVAPAPVQVPAVAATPSTPVAPAAPVEPIAAVAPLAPVVGYALVQDDELEEEARRLEEEVARLRKQLEAMRGELKGSKRRVQRIRLTEDGERQSRVSRERRNADAKERAARSRERAEAAKERAVARAKESRARAEVRAVDARNRADATRKRALALVEGRMAEVEAKRKETKERILATVEGRKAKAKERANVRFGTLAKRKKGEDGGPTIWTTTIAPHADGDHAGGTHTVEGVKLRTTKEVHTHPGGGAHTIFIQDHDGDAPKVRSFKGSDGSTFNIHVEDGDVHIYTGGGGAHASSGVWTSKAPSVFGKDGSKEVRVRKLWKTDAEAPKGGFIFEAKEHEDHDHDHDGDHGDDRFVFKVDGDGDHEAFAWSFDGDVNFGADGVIEVDGKKIELHGLGDKIAGINLKTIKGLNGALGGKLEILGDLEGLDIGDIELDALSKVDLGDLGVDVEMLNGKGLAIGKRLILGGDVKEGHNLFFGKLHEGHEIAEIVEGHEIGEIFEGHKIHEHIGGLNLDGDAKVLIKMIDEDGNLKELTGDAALEFIKEGEGMKNLFEDAMKNVEIEFEVIEECEEEEEVEEDEGDGNSVVFGRSFPLVPGMKVNTESGFTPAFPHLVPGHNVYTPAGLTTGTTEAELLQVARDIQEQIEAMRIELDALRREVMSQAKK